MAWRFRRGGERQRGIVCALIGCAALASGCGLETRGSVLFETSDAGGDASQLALRGEMATAVEGGDSGTLHVDLCPDEQILVGYAGTLREISVTADDIEVIGSLEGVCARLSYDAAADIVSVSSGEQLATRGDARGAYGAWTRVCPTDHSLVGVIGRTGLAVDQLALVCARWQFDTAQERFVVASETTLASVGGSGGSEIALRCPAGQGARGQSLRSGRWIDAFGLVCATPVLPP